MFVSYKARLAGLLLIVCALLVMTPVAAEDDRQAGLSGAIGLRMHVNDVNRADENEIEVSEAFLRSGIEITYDFGNGFSIGASASLEGEPVAYGEARYHDLFFDDHPLAVDDLVLNYVYGQAHLYAGKFTAPIGMDAGDFPGIYTYLTIEEYEIADRLGLGLNYTVETCLLYTSDAADE